MLLKMMVEYCQCVNDIPSAAPDLMSRLVDLFKVSGRIVKGRTEHDINTHHRLGKYHMTFKFWVLFCRFSIQELVSWCWVLAPFN
jgi:hypothetical protein